MSSQTMGAEAVASSPSLDNITQGSSKRGQDLEKIFVQSFKHQMGACGVARAVRYVEKKLDYVADDERIIRNPETFGIVQAICGAALKADVPVGPVPLWRLQHNAEECGAEDLAKYIEEQSKLFRKQQTSFSGRIWRDIRRLFIPTHG